MLQTTPFIMILLPIRVFNLMKIAGSYLVSRIIKKPVHWGNPVAASMEPNNNCNLRCPECPAGRRELSRPRGFMDAALMRSAIEQLSPHLSYLTLYFQGEPYLNKNLFEFISFARAGKIFVTTSTNGHFLDDSSVRKTIESGLNRMIISLDGAGRESYGAYRRGGEFEKVVEGIRLLVNEKKRLGKRNPEIVLQCLLLRTNEHELDKIRALAKELGVDKLEFKKAQFYDFEEGNLLMPENQAYSRYERVGERKMQRAKYRIKNPLRNTCFRMWSSCVITWDGKVVPCCFDKDAGHVMGDLARQGFREIWRDQPYRDFRKRILAGRKSVEMCCNCSQTF